MLNQNADTFTVKDFTLSDSVVMPKRCCLIILASGSSPPSLEIHTGSYLAFQWCVSHAQRMHELIPVASRPQGSGHAADVVAFEAIFTILRLGMEDIITAGNLCSKPFATTVQRLSATMV
jgi:hypothetical protein